MLPHNTPKDTLINLRIHSATRDFIDHAAQVSGKARSDFMLEASLEKAQTVLLDRRLFVLDEQQWEKFNALLDNPPEPNEKLRKLLVTPAPWE